MLSLPLLDAMVPAATVLAQTAASAEAALRRPVRAARDGAGLLGAREGRRARRRAAVQLEAARAVRQAVHDDSERAALASAEPPPGVTGADHWVAAAFMCAVKPRKTAGADVYCGTTIDQLIAQKIGRENLMPSMQLAVEDPGANSSNCGEGYSCTYTNTISWASPSSPLPMELNPQVVFERMFGDGSTAEQRTARRKRDQSILDSLTGSLNRLRGEVSASTRRASTTTRRTCARSSAGSTSR
jgi:hypothetical protein